MSDVVDGFSGILHGPTTITVGEAGRRDVVNVERREPCPPISRELLESVDPSPARDVPRVDHLTADVERLARFLYGRFHDRPIDPNDEDMLPARPWEKAQMPIRKNWLDVARRCVRELNELEDILGEILTKGGRF